ncbi:MAG: hypothetical protein WKF30_14835 [Pyrinomonadaceae bacterium]
MLWVVLVYLVINLFLLGLGLGLGFLLHWVLPAVDLGVGILIGVVTTGLATHFFLRLNHLSEEVEDEAMMQEIASRMRENLFEPSSSARPRKKRSRPRRPIAAVIPIKPHEDD